MLFYYVIPLILDNFKTRNIPLFLFVYKTTIKVMKTAFLPENSGNKSCFIGRNIPNK